MHAPIHSAKLPPLSQQWGLRWQGGQPWGGWKKQHVTLVVEGEGAQACAQPGKWPACDPR